MENEQISKKLILVHILHLIENIYLFQFLFLGQLFFFFFYPYLLNSFKFNPSWLSYGFWLIGDTFDYISLLFIWAILSIIFWIKEALVNLIFQHSHLLNQNHRIGDQEKFEQYVYLTDLKADLKLKKHTPHKLLLNWDQFTQKWLYWQINQLENSNYLSNVTTWLRSLYRLNYSLTFLLNPHRFYFNWNSKPNFLFNWTSLSFYFSLGDLNRSEFKNLFFLTKYENNYSSLPIQNQNFLLKPSLSWNQYITLNTKYLNLINLDHLWQSSYNLRRIDRWLKLYSTQGRYSNTHLLRIREIKKNLSSPFFSNNIFSTNIWASSFVENLHNYNPLKISTLKIIPNNYSSVENLLNTVDSFVRLPSNQSNRLKYFSSNYQFLTQRVWSLTSLNFNRRLITLTPNNTQNALNYNNLSFLNESELWGKLVLLNSSPNVDLTNFLVPFNSEIPSFVNTLKSNSLETNFFNIENSQFLFFTDYDLWILLKLWNFNKYIPVTLYSPIQLSEEDLDISF